MSVRTLPVLDCPACGSTSASAVAFGDAGLHRCDACGLVHASAMADPADVYVEGYLTGATDFGPPDTTDPAFQRFLHFCGHRRLAAIERRIGAPVGPLLDVGCGTGDVLVAAKERGIDAVGVEPVAESVEVARARGVDVRHALLADSGLPPSSFRAVTAFHVLEHMADGAGLLASMARWARRGNGWVVVEVPNWRSVERRAKGVDWPGLRPLEHVAHYTPATLAAALERAGLVDVAVHTTTFQWPEQPLRFALGDLGLGRLNRTRLGAALRRRYGDDRPAPAWARLALRAVAAAYDAAKVGQVVVAMGRRPWS